MNQDSKLPISVLLKSAKSMGNLQAWSSKMKELRDENQILKWIFLNEPQHIMLEIEWFQSSFSEEDIEKLREEVSKYMNKDV